MKKKLTALQQAKLKQAHALAGKPKVEKSQRLGPPKGQAIPREIKAKAKSLRETGTSRIDVCRKLKLNESTIKNWEERETWVTREAIAKKAVELKQRAAGIKPAKPRGISKRTTSNNIRSDKAKRELNSSGSNEIIEARALTLLQVGEQNAELVAREVSDLIKTSFKTKQIKPPKDLSELSIAHKLVESATGRSKPQVQVALGVQVHPLMTSVVGEIRTSTATLDEDTSQDASPAWLGGQLNDDGDDGL